MINFKYQKYLGFALLLLIAILLASYLAKQYYQASLASYKTTQVNIANENYKLFIADTDEKRIQGLSYVKKLKEDEGMIFYFPEEAYLKFWMKDMNFPIDMIFLNGEKVVTVYHNVPPESFPKTYAPNEPTDVVIELNAGEAQNVKPEDIIIFTKP